LLRSARAAALPPYAIFDLCEARRAKHGALAAGRSPPAESVLVARIIIITAPRLMRGAVREWKRLPASKSEFE